MLWKRTVPFFLILTPVLALSVACATLTSLERPEIRAVRPRITGIDFQGLNLVFDIDVNNPYPVSIRTPRFRYGIDIEGSKLFDSEAASNIDLPAMRVGTVPVPVRLSYSDLLSMHQEVSGLPEVDYRLHGALIFPVLGRSFELPVSHNGTVPILKPPAFSDIKFRVDSVSLTGARINIDAAMKNPNVFALGIEDLGYVLKLGDTKIGGLTARTNDMLGAGETERISLSGGISVAGALSNQIRDGAFGDAKIVPSGSIQTPHGGVKLQPGP
jgi:LEA14-like dessication related protein